MQHSWAWPLRTTPFPGAIDFVDERGHVGVDFGFERYGQHAPGALADDLVQARHQLRARLLVSYYSQHGRSFLAGVTAPTSSIDQ
jgi:hypothetical protein